ncbi:UvrD-helicase domain-containing protein [Microbacterium sp. KSW2-21]|uniref:UvrD-helicase domain-containing protein n=1 Tax=Microbacterium algihabitans TaxID=3075992 RepID=A0ABU3RZ29_9MICO|nr:UvrD-helicase domain-containing protein [Microbacterium sp. KSW2-21]MDU0328122.1 UvrD-helicase domain-containing protein [Microbacterium sp. KSW2-21]
MAEPEALAQIADALANKESFVLEAGAGSGKTRTLIDTVQLVLAQERESMVKTGRQVVCITYTNVAKDEITHRLNADPLALVGTIHEFLWQVVSPFQRELRLEILAINATAKKSIEGLDALLSTQSVTYGQFGRHFDRGELSHDDVLTVSGELFTKYPKIVRIAANRFPFIFVDEYQDTSESVVALLLNHFVKSDQKPVVGFFGDTMQQIYDSKISDVAGTHGLRLVTKLENYRCSIAVIDVLNRLRTDIQQVPAGQNLPGLVHLLTASAGSPDVYEAAMTHLAPSGWTRENTKTLMLTHKGIAREVGFTSLVDAYGKRSFGTEQLMQRDDEFGEFFTYIGALVGSYDSRRFGVFLNLLGQSGFEFKAASQKAEIATEINGLKELLSTKNVGEVVDFVAASPLIPLPKKIRQLRERMSSVTEEGDSVFEKKKVFYDAVRGVAWSQIRNFLDYADEFTPFSTKHGVKGAEFENVLVIVDDSLWNMYKFGQVFTDDRSNSGRFERSQKLLYVCFSRAMDGLAVLWLGGSSSGELAGLKTLLNVSTSTAIST